MKSGGIEFCTLNHFLSKGEFVRASSEMPFKIEHICSTLPEEVPNAGGSTSSVEIFLSGICGKKISMIKFTRTKDIKLCPPFGLVTGELRFGTQDVGVITFYANVANFLCTSKY